MYRELVVCSRCGCVVEKVGKGYRHRVWNGTYGGHPVKPKVIAETETELRMAWGDR